MLKTLGHSTLQLLPGNNECNNAELALLRRWRCQTTGPNTDHKTPRVSSSFRRSLSPKSNLDPHYYDKQRNYRTYLHHYEKVCQNSRSA